MNLDALTSGTEGLRGADFTELAIAPGEDSGAWRKLENIRYRQRGKHIVWEPRGGSQRVGTESDNLDNITLGVGDDDIINISGATVNVSGSRKDILFFQTDAGRLLGTIFDGVVPGSIHTILGNGELSGAVPAQIMVVGRFIYLNQGKEYRAKVIEVVDDASPFVVDDWMPDTNARIGAASLVSVEEKIFKNGEENVFGFEEGASAIAFPTFIAARNVRPIVSWTKNPDDERETSFELHDLEGLMVFRRNHSGQSIVASEGQSPFLSTVGDVGTVYYKRSGVGLKVRWTDKDDYGSPWPDMWFISTVPYTGLQSPFNLWDIAGNRSIGNPFGTAIQPNRSIETYMAGRKARVISPRSPVRSFMTTSVPERDQRTVAIEEGGYEMNAHYVDYESDGTRRVEHVARMLVPDTPPFQSLLDAPGLVNNSEAYSFDTTQIQGGSFIGPRLDIDAEISESYRLPSLYRGYTIIDMYKDGSYSMPSRPTIVYASAYDVAIGYLGRVRMSMPEAAPGVAKRFLFSTKWFPTVDPIMSGSTEFEPNGPYYYSAELRLEEYADDRTYFDTRSDSRLTVPMSAFIDISAGRHQMFAPDQIRAEVASSVRGGLLIGDYQIKRPFPVFGENLYIRRPFGGNVGVDVIFEYTDGTRSRVFTYEPMSEPILGSIYPEHSDGDPIDFDGGRDSGPWIPPPPPPPPPNTSDNDGFWSPGETISEYAEPVSTTNYVSVYPNSPLVSKVYILRQNYLDTGSQILPWGDKYIVKAVERNDPEFDGKPIDWDTVLETQDNVPFNMASLGDEVESVDIKDRIALAQPVNTISITNQSLLSSYGQVLAIAPMKYDPDKTELRYTIVVGTDRNIQVGYITEGETNISFETLTVDYGVRGRDGVIRLGESVYIATPRGISVINDQGFRPLIDSDRYPDTSGRLLSIDRNPERSDVWFSFEGMNGYLVYNEETQQFFRFFYNFSDNIVRYCSYLNGKMLIVAGNSVVATDIKGVTSDYNPDDGGANISVSAESDYIGDPLNQTRILSFDIYGQGADAKILLDLQPQRKEWNTDPWEEEFMPDLTTPVKDMVMSGRSYQIHRRATMPKVRVEFENIQSDAVIFSVMMKAVTLQNKGRAR